MCVCILCCCVVSCHMLRVCLHASVASAGLSLFFFFLFPFVCRYLVLLGGSGGPVCLCFLSACVFSLSMWGWVVGSRPSLSLCCFSLSLFCSLSLAFHLALCVFHFPLYMCFVCGCSTCGFLCSSPLWLFFFLALFHPFLCRFISLARACGGSGGLLYVLAGEFLVSGMNRCSFPRLLGWS